MIGLDDACFSVAVALLARCDCFFERLAAYKYQVYATSQTLALSLVLPPKRSLEHLLAVSRLLSNPRSTMQGPLQSY